MLDVTYGSTDRDLTTTSALRALVFGATATSTAQDAYLSNVIRRSSRWAETFIGAPVTAQTYRETVAGFGRRSLMLSRAPLRSVDAVYDATDTGTAVQLHSSEFAVENADAGQLTRPNGFAWTAPLQALAGYGTFSPALPLESAPLGGQEIKSWLVDYRAGWTFGGLTTDSPNYSTGTPQFGSTTTGRTLPEDVEMGVLLHAQELFENVKGVKRERLGDFDVEYMPPLSSDDPSEAEIFLLPYRSIV